MPFVNHAIIHPPVDRDRPPNEVGDVCVHIEKETDAGMIVSGAKVVATGSALTNYTFVAHHGLIAAARQELRLRLHGADQRAGRKADLPHVVRDDGDGDGSPFDYPLSSRLDENDAVFVLDKVLVPWENVFVYGDIEKANNFFPRTGFLPRACCRGARASRSSWSLSPACCSRRSRRRGRRISAASRRRSARCSAGAICSGGSPMRWPATRSRGSAICAAEHRPAARTGSSATTRIRRSRRSSSRQSPRLIYLNSSRARFPEAGDPPLSRPVLRGSNGYKRRGSREAGEAAVGCDRQRIRRAPRALRDQLGGSTEEIRRYCLIGAQATAQRTGSRASPSSAWRNTTSTAGRVPDMADPGELSYHVMRANQR